MVTRALFLAVVLSFGCQAAPERPAVVRVAYQHPMVTLDPHAHDDGVTGCVLSAVYEGLVVLRRGAGPRPLLAERWTTPDDTTWHFLLRDGVRFHDGTPLEADDVVAAIRRARFAAESALATYMQALVDVRVVPGPARVVEVRTSAPFPLLLTRLAMVAITPRDFDPASPIGTGPYRWVSGGPDGPLVLHRFAGYWGDPPAIDEVDVSFVESEDELARLIGERRLDVVASVSDELVRRGVLGPRWRQVRIPSVATTVLGINTSRWPLSDVRVREAIDLAIDRDRLVRRAFPENAVSPAPTLVPPEVFGFAPCEHPTGADPERARRLLAAAGVPRGTEVELGCSGVPAPVLGYLVAALDRIGLELVVAERDWEEVYRRIEEGSNSLFVFGWNFARLDASDFLDAVVHSRDPATQLGGLNGASYSDLEIDRWIEEAGREPRSGARLELLRRTLARVAEDRPYLPLYRRSRLALAAAPFTISSHSWSWVIPYEIELAER